MLIRQGRLPDGRIADIRVDERIVEIADRLDPLDAEQVIDADAGAVLPGLHDHHLHLQAMAAALDSSWSGRRSGRKQLAQALKRPNRGPDGWIQAVGYHASVAGARPRTARHPRRHAGADPAPQRCDVDPELGCAVPRRLADHPDGGCTAPTTGRTPCRAG